MQSGAVLNGIAYNKKEKTLYITGKLWPEIFEIRIQ
jgi:glutamine cyclotransferase